ncbi:MAG: hypothetical protein IEMM0002_1147 [bacterium]|nr:MAG: hypothetical protein IEMM0002_1147 [bacterium]
MIRALPVLMLMFICIHPALAAEVSKDEIVKKLENRMAYIKNFTAGFKQRFFNASMGETEESSGLVAMQKPLKMRWEYMEPEKQTILSDGKWIYFYVPRDKQVMVEPIGRLLGSHSPALFLIGEKKLTELFNIELEPASNKDKINDVGLSLHPKEKNLTVKRVVIRAERGDFTIRSFTLFDRVGNRTEIEFSDMKLNTGIDPEKFVFIKPKGVERVEIPRLDIGSE